MAASAGCKSGPCIRAPVKPATRVIVQGLKGSRAPLKLLPGLVLHRPDGTFAPEVERVLRGPVALEWPRT